MKNLTTLKPNELIRLAITDMKATLAQGHTINMNYWGENIGTPNCSVCFAGSIMLQQNKTPNMYNGFSIDANDINQSIYYALDAIRQGDLKTFCNYLNVENPLIKKLGLSLTHFDIKYQKGNVEDFYTQMENIAKLFD